MKGFGSILFLFWWAVTQAQHSVQTIVPLQPVAVGTAFQVQYIVTDNEPAIELQSPAFGKDFRFVSGPRLYEGEAVINNIKTPIQNFSYTLIPLRKGRLVVKGATAVFGSRKLKSEDTFVMVTDKVKQDTLATTPVSDWPRLAPGVNWDAKVQEALFIKTVVSKQSCFVGEPVVATFTLFSRLPSASEVIKNPGFYGFSVSDMPDATEGAQTVQTYNGAFYNTHILRHVQLYPAQAGSLIIDKMSVNNAIEYADSASGAPVRTEVVLESKPTTVLVKPLPSAALQNYTGAVGRFSINAYMEKKEWPQTNNGQLTVTISGAGNFLQFTAPEIHWPEGVDAFEPVLTERLQKDAVPVSGTRTYTYTFTTDSAGRYAMPPIAFTYFNPVEKKYKTAATDSLYFTVLKNNVKAIKSFGIKQKVPGANTLLWLAGLFVLIFASAFLVKKYHHQKQRLPTAPVENKPPDFEELLRHISPGDSDAYRQLQQHLMGFLKSLHAPTNPPTGSAQPAAAALSTNEQKTLHAILDECEAVQYYGAAPTISFTELRLQALHFIQAAKDSSSGAPGRM